MTEKCVCQFEFHWSLFLRVQLTISLGSGICLEPNRRQTITWASADPFQRRIYPARGEDESNRRWRYGLNNYNPHLGCNLLSIPYSQYWRIWLTHRGRDKMNAISQTTFSRAFSWMKTFEFRLNFRRPGDKPLSEPMVVNLLTHICVTRPQWVNICW